MTTLANQVGDSRSCVHCVSLALGAALLALGIVGCSGSTNNSTSLSGGVTSVAKGGASAASGGDGLPVGGASAAGGAAATGGLTNAASTQATGGATSVATLASGGMSSIGGSSDTGSAQYAGGTGGATGATVATGGTHAQAGSSAAGGSKAAGGVSNAGGNTASGGASNTGGTQAIGGNTAASGGNTAVAGGSGAAGGSTTTTTAPTLITSAQNAYWKPGTLTTVSTGTADVTVNSSTTYQTFTGFGGTFNEVGWNVLSMLNASDRDLAMNLLFGLDGARFVYGRVPIGASDYAMSRYTLNDTANDYTQDNFSISRDQQQLIPYIQAALALNSGVHLWASPWSPPAWMKDNNASDGGNMKDDAKILQAHAIYLSKFVEEYGKLGITIEAVHPQNEPGYSTLYPSCLWTAALYTKFVRDYLGPTFASRGVTAQIFLGTMSNADAGKDGTIISTLTADTQAMQFIKGFGLQWNMINSVSGLTSLKLPIVQTEHKCGNYPWDTANYNANQAPNDYAYGVESWGLIRDWLNAGVNVYSAWNMVLDTVGKNLASSNPWPQNALLTVDTSKKTLTITPAYYVFRHVSQYVAPGATRIGTTGGDALAFKNPDGTIVTIMYNSGAAKTAILAVGSTKLQFAMPNNGWATVTSK